MEQAPKRDHAPFGHKKAKKKAARVGAPTQPFFPATPKPPPPEDHRVPGVKPDFLGVAASMFGDVGHSLVSAAAPLHSVAKAATTTDPNAAIINMRAAAETAALVSNMGYVGEREGRWKFLNTLDRIDDPAVRAKVRQQFEAQTHQSLDSFIDGAGWHSARDKEQARDMISDKRDAAETNLTALAKTDPEKYKQKKNEAILLAGKVLDKTRSDDIDDDATAKLIFDTLGPRSPEEIELIRAEVRTQTKNRSIYQEIDKSLSGGTEDEALAGLKGSKVTSTIAGIMNADGNAARIQELLRRLSPAEVAQLNATNPMMQYIATSSVAGSQRAEILALFETGKPGKEGMDAKARANGAHIADLLKPPEADAEAESNIKLSKQTELNFENRKPDNVIRELRNMSAADIRSAREQWDSDPGNKGHTFAEMIESRFGDGDSSTLLRIRSLVDGDKAGERALALRDGIRKQNQDQIEAALANPDLKSKDPEKQAAAVAEQKRLEAEVYKLDVAGKRTAAMMSGEDPNAVIGDNLKQQLSHYYMEYGDKLPLPKELENITKTLADPDAIKDERSKKAHDDAIAASELASSGELSTTSQIRRADSKGDSETKAQLLENLESSSERQKIERDFHARYGKDVYADPHAAQFEAMARYKKECQGDDRPLSEIKIEIADESRNANEHRIHNVDVYGAKVERDPYLELQLQKEQYARQHSGSLEADERMRDLRGGNLGIEDLVQHKIENMEALFEKKNDNPFDMTPPSLKAGADEEYKARDKSLTSSLETQRSEKMKHGERLARAFSTIAKIAAIVTMQPHLVFLIDMAAGLTEMAIKSSTMGNDYDSSLDQKMLVLTGVVDGLTWGLSKYVGAAASKIDDIAAAEQLGKSTATELTEQAVTTEAKKELAGSAAKQVAATEARVAGKVAASTDEAVEGGLTIAKAEQAMAKVETSAIKDTTSSAMKTLQTTETLGNVGINVGGGIAGGMINGEGGDDILMGAGRSILGMLIPGKLGDKIDDIVGKNVVGTVLKFGANFASDVIVQGNDVKMALVGAGSNAYHSRRANKAQHAHGDDAHLGPRRVGDDGDHPMSYWAEEPTYTRPLADDEPSVVKKPASEPADPHLVANGHNAEIDAPLVPYPIDVPTHGQSPAAPTETSIGPNLPSIQQSAKRPNLDVERKPKPPIPHDADTQTRIDLLTGARKDSEYLQFNDDMRAMYAQQELEAARVIRVNDQHFDEANPGYTNNLWNSSYSVREFSYDNATLTQLGVDIHLHPGKGVNDGNLADVRSNTLKGIDRTVNFAPEGGHLNALPNGNVLQLEPRFVDTPAGADVSVLVQGGRFDPDTGERLRTHMTQWLLPDVAPRNDERGIAPFNAAHEVLHVTGTHDEYPSPEFKGRETDTSPKTFFDGSIMGSYHQEGGIPELKPRHLEQLQNDISRSREVSAAATLRMPAQTESDVPLSDSAAETLRFAAQTNQTDDSVMSDAATSAQAGRVVTSDPAAETLRFPVQNDGDLDSPLKQVSDSKRNTVGLTPDEVAYATARAVDLGMSPENISDRSNDASARTSWGQVFGMEQMHIADDLKPAEPHQDRFGNWVSLTPNQRVSIDGTLGHEVVGHRAADLAGKSKVQSYADYNAMDPETRQSTQARDVALDEAQASLRAAKFTPGLSNKERTVLFNDAMSRLEKVGLTIDDVPDLDLYLDAP